MDKLLAVLNQIVAKQLDTAAVMTTLGAMDLKLESIATDVRQIRDSQGWLPIQVSDLEGIREVLRQFKDQVIEIEVPNPERDTLELANTLGTALRLSQWNASVQTPMRLYPPNTTLPLGVHVRVKEDSPARQALSGVLSALLGESRIQSYRDDRVPQGTIRLSVYWRPR